MDTPISPPTVEGGGERELPAYVANGLIGLRVRAMPLAAGMTLLSGYTGEHPERRIEAAALAPYPIAADLALNGVWLSDVPHLVHALQQAYDFSTGELTSRFMFEAAGCKAKIAVVTFCSRHDPTLVCQEIAVTVNASADVGLRAIIDAQACDGRALRQSRDTPGESQPAVDGALLWEAPGGLSTCGLALASELVGGGDAVPGRPALRNNRMVSEYALRLRGGQTVRLRQLASVIPDALHHLPDQQAVRLAAKARNEGWMKVRAANRAAWDDLWKGRIRLVGADDRWQALADAAFFYLNCSVHASSPASTSIFGLATWHDYHYYYGHVMWDIEAFAVPPLTLLQPQAAAALLDFRSRTLQAARGNARLLGRGGLQFPWESAPRSGQEAAPMPGTAAWHEDHVSLVVARAFALYAEVSGDREFKRTKAWPVLSGVAEWLTTRVKPTRKGYDFAQSMGIAERETPVSNAAFTNMAAVVVLRQAIAAAAELGFSCDPAWSDIADRLAIPRRGPIVVSHDRYRTNEEKGATPDPLMGIFPFGFALPEADEQATLAFYLERAEDYLGSPMLSALYGAWAARTGDRKLALKLLDDGYGKFCVGRFLQTLEYRADRFPEQPRAGPFFGNIGGFLTTLLFGFPGLTAKGGPETWARRPVVLPQGWTAIEVDRLWVHDRPMSLRAAQGADRAELG